MFDYDCSSIVLYLHFLVCPGRFIELCVTAKRKGRRKAKEKTRKETRKEGLNLLCLSLVSLTAV